MAAACEIVRGKFTAAVSYIAAVSILTAFGFVLITTRGISACCDEEYSNSSSLDNSGEICLLLSMLKIEESISLKGTTSYWASEIMATMFKSNLTEHIPLSLESILTLEVEDEVAVVILCLPVLFAVLLELYTIYTRKKQFTYSVVVELREQLEEQLTRNKALRTEYRKINLVAKRCCARSYRYNVSPNRNRHGRSQKGSRGKRDVSQPSKRVSYNKKVAETSDFSTRESSDSDDGQGSLVLRERTGQKSSLALKTSCDTAVKYENAHPSAILTGFSNVETWNCSIESTLAISNVTTFESLQKTATSFGVNLPASTSVFLDSSVAGPSTKTLFVPSDAQPVCTVEEKCNRALGLLMHLRQTDFPPMSLSQTYPSSGSRPVCRNTVISLSASVPGSRTWKSDSLDVLPGFVDNKASTARIPVIFNVKIGRCRSLPDFVDADFNATVQTRQYSQSWTGSLSLLCSSQRNSSVSSKIVADVSSYNRASRSLEDLQWRCDKTTVISTVYSSSWSPGDTTFTDCGEWETLGNCNAPFSGKCMKITRATCSGSTSENDISGINFCSSSSWSSVGSSEDMFQDTPPNATPDYARARQSLQLISAAEVPGADLHLDRPVGSLEYSSSGSSLSVNSELQSETSSIGSDLERALFGEPEDIIAAAQGYRTVDLSQSSELFADPVGARPSSSTPAVDLAGSAKCKQYASASEILVDFPTGNSMRQPLIPLASTPIGCNDKFDFAVNKDDMSFLKIDLGQLEPSESRPSSQENFDYQFGLRNDFGSEQKAVHPKQYELRPFDPIGYHRMPMASARLMSNCSSICCSPLVRQRSSALEMLQASGISETSSEISAEGDTSFDESSELDSQAELSTRELIRDHFPQIEKQEHLMAEEELYEYCGNSRESSDASHTPIRRRYSGEAQAIASLQSVRSPTFTRLPRYLHPMRNVLRIDLSAVFTQRNMRKSGRSLDSSGYIFTYTPSVEEGSLPIVSWRLWKAAEKSRTLQSILVDIYGPPSSGVSGETFLRGLWNSPRNGGLAAVILDKTPSSARRALLQYLEANDDVKYTRYQVELYAQMAALSDSERMRFCNEAQRRGRQALNVLEQKREVLKAALAADDERPKKALARFFKALNCFRKPKQRGVELVNVCSDISALRRQLLELDEVCDEVKVERQSNIRRRHLQERILACEKALVDCVRRGLTLRSKMKGQNAGVRCYDCDVGRHEPPMIVPHIPSPLLGEHNGFSCDCPLIQDINSRYVALDLDSCRISHEKKLDCIQQLQKKVQVGLFRKSFLLNGQIAL